MIGADGKYPSNYLPKPLSSKYKKLLPNILSSSFDAINNIDKKSTSISFVAPIASSSMKKYGKDRHSLSKHSRTQSVLLKAQIKQREKLARMEKSMIRFANKQNNFMKTLLQKRKQKKHFTAESFKNEEMDFFNSLGLHNLANQEISEQQVTSKQYKIKNLPSSCYDSQFIYHREGSCLAMLNNKIYLFGGTIRRKVYFHQTQNRINSDMLFHSYDNGCWIKENVINQVSSDKRNLIHHTVNSVHKKFILIAGGMMGDSQKTLSKFNESIMLYNVETHKIQQISWNCCIRSHASASFDYQVILHGGINEDGQIRSDLHVVSLCGSGQNYGIKISRYETSQSLAHHQMITTLGEDKNFMINLRQNNGIYLFGGEDQNGNMDNKLKILRLYSITQLQRKSIKSFQILNTFGQAPCARKNHSMSLLQRKNSLLIIGGLDQKINLLSDIWLLQLFHLKWCRIQTDPTIQQTLGGICKHATAFHNNNVYILGGRYGKQIESSNMWQIDFNVQAFEKKPKQKKVSFTTKFSSCWSFGANDVETENKIHISNRRGKGFQL